MKLNKKLNKHVKYVLMMNNKQLLKLDVNILYVKIVFKI